MAAKGGAVEVMRPVSDRIIHEAVGRATRYYNDGRHGGKSYFEFGISASARGDFISKDVVDYLRETVRGVTKKSSNSAPIDALGPHGEIIEIKTTSSKSGRVMSNAVTKHVKAFYIIICVDCSTPTMRVVDVRADVLLPSDWLPPAKHTQMRFLKPSSFARMHRVITYRELKVNMSHNSKQAHPEFTPRGSVEHERKDAVKAVLTEGNDVAAMLEESGPLSAFTTLDATLRRLALAFYGTEDYGAVAAK